MDSILRYLQVRSFGRGLRGEHTAWFVIGAAIWMLIRARNQTDVVYRHRLEPGERLLIRAGRSSATPDS